MNLDSIIKNPYLLIVSVSIALSSSGTVMTLISLSSELLSNTGRSQWSALIETCSYVGTAVVGVLGGYLLQRVSSARMGSYTALLGFPFSIILFFKEPLGPFTGLVSVFILFCLSGIEMPNYIAFFNKILKEKEKLAFFSFLQTLNMVAAFISPILAIFLIKLYGPKICYLIDSLSFVFLFISWKILGAKYSAKECNNKRISVNNKVDWFLGFKEIGKNHNIKKITISRVLYCLVYAPFLTSIPIWLNYLTSNTDLSFSSNLGYSNSSRAIGFLLASIMASFGLIKNKHLSIAIWLASFLPIFGILFIIHSSDLRTFIFSCFLLGLGNFFFRISVIRLGQFYTPQDKLGPTIVAGDSIIRFAAFIISSISVSISTFLPLTYANYVILFLGILSIIAPVLLKKLAKNIKG